MNKNEGPLGRIQQQAESKVRHSWRPKPKETAGTGDKCPYCGEAIAAGDVMCSHCGRSLTPDKCSFCGRPMKLTAKFCTGCGQSCEGVVCPVCGTLNSRNFCRKCNTALTPMAIKVLEDAKNDPQFKALKQKAADLAELHQHIEELRNGSGGHDAPPPALSAEDQALLDEYAEILGAIGAYKPVAPKQSQPEEAQRPRFSYDVMSLEEMLDAYREKAEEMNEALAALVPPPDFTPEQQRDYYSARRVATVSTDVDMSGYNPNLWKCNYCGCLHEQPSECTRPELGGVWIFVTPEQYRAENPQLPMTSIKFTVN